MSTHFSKFHFLFIFLWFYGLISVFEASYPKELLFIVILVFILFLLKNSRLLKKKITLSLFLFLSLIPGILPFQQNPEVLMYFMVGSVNIFCLAIYPRFNFSFRLFYIYLITLLLMCLIWMNFNKLYIFGIQPSITDLFLSVISIFLYLKCNNKKIKFYLLFLNLIYGYLFDSRLVMFSIIFVEVISFIYRKYPLALKRTFFISYFLVVLFIIFFAWYTLPEQIKANVGNISELYNLIGDEAKRLSLIINGLYVSDRFPMYGVGFGPKVYNLYVLDNPLGIAPQLLPLTLSCYVGKIFAFTYCAGLYRWVSTSTNSLSFSAKLFLLFFIFFHEYVFNPFFGLAVLLINSIDYDNFYS